MQYWVNWAYQHAPSWLRAGVDWLVGFVMGVVGVVTASLTGNRTGWLKLYRAYQQFRSAMAQFAVAVPNTLAWLRNTWVPRLARWAKDVAIGYVNVVAGVINRAWQAAISLLDRARRAAEAALARGLALLTRFTNEAIAAIMRLIPEPIRRAWQMLLDPRRIAEWAASAIFFALLRLAERNAVIIGRWVRVQSVPWTLAIARFLESVIVRIL